MASTFRPSVSGAGAVLDALDTFLNGFDGLFHGGLEASLWPMLVVVLVVLVFPERWFRFDVRQPLIAASGS